MNIFYVSEYLRTSLIICQNVLVCTCPVPHNLEELFMKSKKHHVLVKPSVWILQTDFIKDCRYLPVNVFLMHFLHIICISFVILATNIKWFHHYWLIHCFEWSKAMKVFIRWALGSRNCIHGSVSGLSNGYHCNSILHVSHIFCSNR